MKRAWIRSTLFNIAFMAMTLVCCIAFLPTLLLPRKAHLAFNKIWHLLIVFLEYTVLGLTYEVRGREYLPKEGSYIVAAKHMSPYETMKLRLLFNDPAIILKKELLRIPLWGAYLRKSDVIAIDRATKELAMQSMEDGALRMKAQGRPIVIFPQGTRVAPNETSHDKPYKFGITRVQEATQLDIIPMATNSGLFWPRKGWLKTPGRVVFKFLPPIPPGKDRKALLDEIEEKLEEESGALMNEARAEVLQDKYAGLKAALKLIIFLTLAFCGYTWLWKFSAQVALQGYERLMTDLSNHQITPAVPRLSGFPGRITLSVDHDTVQLPDLSIQFEDLEVKGWPLPILPVHVQAGPAILTSYKWQAPLRVDSLEGHVRFWNNILTVTDSELKIDSFTAQAEGRVDLKAEPVPALDFMVSMKNHAPFLNTLAQRKILKERMAMFMSAAFTALQDEEGVVRVPITQRGPTLYAGPIPIYTRE